MAAKNNTTMLIAGIAAVGIIYFMTRPKANAVPPVPIAPANNPLIEQSPYTNPTISDIISNLGASRPIVSPINNPIPLDLDYSPAGNAQYFTV